ncbi:MAG: RNA polymerase sigma factor [bacterium]
MPQAHPPDEELVAQARRGDDAAFGALVRRHQDGLFNGICRMVGRREDAEDLAQEVFVKAYRHIARFEGRSSFYTWVYSIAVNVVISHRRKQSTRRRQSTVSLDAIVGDDGPFEVMDDAAGPDRVSQQHEVGERIEQAIAQLEDDQRDIVVLRDIEGFSYEEIGELLGLPQGTVKSRLHRARLALREQLEDLVG